jgi:hypothetical protein
MSPAACQLFIFSSGIYRQGFSSSAFGWVFTATTACPTKQLPATQVSKFLTTYAGFARIIRTFVQKG